MILLEVFWKSGVVLGGALCLCGLLRKRSADARRLVLSTVVLAIVVSTAALAGSAALDNGCAALVRVRAILRPVFSGPIAGPGGESTSGWNLRPTRSLPRSHAYRHALSISFLGLYPSSGSPALRRF